MRYKVKKNISGIIHFEFNTKSASSGLCGWDLLRFDCLFLNPDWCTGVCDITFLQQKTKTDISIMSNNHNCLNFGRRSCVYVGSQKLIRKIRFRDPLTIK